MRIILLGLLLVSFNLQAEPRLRPPDWGVAIIGSELDNLYQVDKGIYRASQPDEEDVADLKALGIKEVLNLRQYHSDEGELQAGGFKLDRIKMNAGEVTQAQLLTALRVIKNRQGPILIHCWHGSDRTGVTIAAYRIVFEGWSKSQAIDEMRHGGYGYHAHFYPNLVVLLKHLDVVKMRKALGL